MKPIRLLFSLLFTVITLPAFSQVSNDNEDGVYKVDERMRNNDFVPGQVLVKFKDESQIEVRRNAKGKFRAASISAVDKLLREYGIDEMEKLVPAEVAKPKSQLRKKVKGLQSDSGSTYKLKKKEAYRLRRALAKEIS